MLNVANLKPEHFRRILAGEKCTEWRDRKRRDARLESIAVGEPVLLLEIGSDRAIAARVRAIVRFDYDDGHCYAIRLVDPMLITDARPRRQGWIRQAA